MLRDLRFTLRQLAKSPGFAFTAIVTLALGIGANAVVFSILNAIVLHPVNVPHADALYNVQRFQFPSQSYPDYIDLRDRNRSFSYLVAIDLVGPVGVDSGGNPTTAWPDLTSGNYFDALETQPYLGRLFHASDEKGPDSAPYVVLSYAFWDSYFHADRGVLGKPVLINRHPFTVIGVAPPGFRGTELFFAPAFWAPIVDVKTITGDDLLKYRGDHSPFVLGRLRPGVTPAQATDDINSIAAALAKAYPSDDDGLKFSLAHPGLIGDMLGGPARAFMAGLMLLAGLILLAACANLGSLFAARAADRAKEVALRLALGSRRALILRQLMTEALLVSLVGGLIGVVGGVIILHGVSAWQPIPAVPINVPVNPDFRTYLVALALSLLSGLFCGLMPVRQVLRADPWQVIRTGSFGVAGLRRVTLRDILLVFQIAICALLVTSSLVAVRGLARSLKSSFGFQPSNVLLVQCDLQMAGYSGDRVPPMQQRMIDAAAALPGVTAVGYTSQIPLDLGGGDSFVYTDATTDYRPTNYAADAMTYHISPGYLRAAGTALLAGRDLTVDDKDKAPVVALVNRQFAVKVFGSVSKAIGGHFKYWGGNRALVVGVVEDGRYRSLTEDQQPAMFFSFQQMKASGTWLIVRTSGDPAQLEPALRASLHNLDSGLPLSLRTWTSELDTALFAPRVATFALGVLGMLGALLAVTGVFGMASYVVSKRLRELGIRVALGANRRQVLRASLGRSVLLLTLGSTGGVVVGVLLSRFLSYIVYQATPRDPVVLVGVCLTMLTLGLAASWLPARRALAVDPMILLREE
jgi:predicted permease